MKLRSLLMGGALVALLGIGVIGCNENPVVDEPVIGSPKPPTALGASSKSPTSVLLSWTAAADTGTITYTLSWSSTGTGGTGSIPNIALTTATVTGLAEGALYKFSVVSNRSGKTSSADTLSFMGAGRFENASLKMYEYNSALGSAIAIDTAAPFSGPRNLVILSEPTLAQLAIIVNPGGTSVDVGSGFAFTEYLVPGLDSLTYMSKASFQANSLDTWYVTKSLDTYIANIDSGNYDRFTFPASQPNNQGYGFFVRTGPAGKYHYARVFLKNTGGKILQGTAPNRYVDVTISYQLTEDMAYAKSARKESPIAVTSQRRRF